MAAVSNSCCHKQLRAANALLFDSCICNSTLNRVLYPVGSVKLLLAALGLPFPPCEK